MCFRIHGGIRGWLIESRPHVNEYAYTCMPSFCQESNAPRSQLVKGLMPNISVFKETYDCFFRSYGEASRERLVELMKNTISTQRLNELSQPDLAKFYCEGLAYSAMGADRIL